LARPLIVAIGGTTRPGSSSEKVLHVAASMAASRGADVKVIAGSLLSQIPIFEPGAVGENPAVRELISAVRDADGIIIATPGYHGSLSGMIKNALDALEELRGDRRPYFDGRAVGTIVVADGGQAGGTALTSLRIIVHALRGWPTPIGLSLNGFGGGLFKDDGGLADPKCSAQLQAMVDQVIDFARSRAEASQAALTV
jgi:FMN reductase